MHLIVCVSKKGLAVPASVPPGLRASVGMGPGPVASLSLSQEHGGSPSPSVPQSPVVRRSSGMQPLQTPWVISSLEPAATSGGTGDAFRWVKAHATAHATARWRVHLRTFIAFVVDEVLSDT